MSANEYNENIDPKKEATVAAAAADALAALGGSSVDKTTKSKTKKSATEPTISMVGDDVTGKNKYVAEAANSKKKNSIKETSTTSEGTAAATATATAAAAATATATAAKEKAPEKKDKLLSGRTFVQIMNGEFLTKDNVVNNLPFTFFIGFLLVILIAWGYYGETVTKKEVQLEKELGELNSEYFTLTADYNMQRGRREIANRLAPLGIKESQTSPKKIRVRKYVFK